MESYRHNWGYRTKVGRLQIAYTDMYGFWGGEILET